MSTQALTAAGRPVTLRVDFRAIPAELRAHPIFLGWRHEEREGKWTKEPWSARTGARASSTDARTWASLEEAGRAYDEGGLDGIGVALGMPGPGNTVLIGVDLDDVRDPDTGELHPEARRIIADLDSYTEVSPSGRGVHVLAFGAPLPDGWRKLSPGKWALAGEIYSSGRYFTLSGARVDGTPPTINVRSAELRAFHQRVADDLAASAPPRNGNGHHPPAAGVTLEDRELVERARRAANGAKFSHLFDDPAGPHEDDSSLDLSLCAILAFWTGMNGQQMDRLVRASARYRPKWDERRGPMTYGAMTIAKAIAQCTDIYNPDRGSAGAGPKAPALVPTPMTTPATLPVLTWAEMTAAEARPVDYHWSGWVALATVALIAGAGESLKSWLALYLAVMTAAGRSALSPDTEAPNVAAGPVLYITAENSIDEEKRRCAALKAGLFLPDELPITFLAAESLSLGRDADYAAIGALVQQLQPMAIFIDSAIALSGIQQENDNAQVRAFMKDRVLPLSRQHGATVYVIVHSPKPSMQPGARFTDEHVARGASDWRNASDTVLYLRRDASLGENAVVIRHAKARVGRRHASIWFTLEDVEPGRAARVVYGGEYQDATGQGAASSELVKAVTAVVDALKAQPAGIYMATLKSEVTAGGISTASYRRAVDIVRGKIAWPHGQHAGKKHPVVTEDKHGAKRFLTFLSTAMPTFSDEDEA